MKDNNYDEISKGNEENKVEATSNQSDLGESEIISKEMQDGKNDGGEGPFESSNVKEFWEAQPEGTKAQPKEEIVTPPKRVKKRLMVVLGIIFGSLLGVYLGLTVYFMGHFEFNTFVNGMNVSGQSVALVEEALKELEKDYRLVLKGRNGKTEEIVGKKINLKIEGSGEVEKLVQKQNPFAWPVSLFSGDLTMTVPVVYDNTLLEQSIKELQMISGPDIVKAESARPVYDGISYNIVEGHLGNQLDGDKFAKAVKLGIEESKDNLDLEQEECYLGTSFEKDSPQVIEANRIMNQYIKSVVTYTFGDASELLNKDIINTWLGVDENMNVIVNSELAKAYLNGLSDKYDTYDKTRNFQTSFGSVVAVGGGDYGWLIDIDGELEELLSILKAGQGVTREPVYASRGVSHGERDYGNTYLEISIGDQHMWFYKNGALVVDTDVVTGSLAGGYGTPSGFFQLAYKATDVVLKGEDYASHVNYWMPYDGDIGVHDASWRGSYGGSIYVNNGSHGCVNTPYAAAETIFYNIEAGDPVIVY
ncbi:MAG: L,D-transpeptidase family protein [Eubacteriaceae bacterium]